MGGSRIHWQIGSMEFWRIKCENLVAARPPMVVSGFNLRFNVVCVVERCSILLVPPDQFDRRAATEIRRRVSHRGLKPTATIGNRSAMNGQRLDRGCEA